MHTSQFFSPAHNIIGQKALSRALETISQWQIQKVLIVTDHALLKMGLVAQVVAQFDLHNIKCAIFDGVQANPTVNNVQDGLAAWQAAEADCIVSVGGGSSHDCAKAIALLVTNGGNIADYAGLNQSKLPQKTLVCINTTAGTSAEMTRFTIIHDEKTKSKITIADKHLTPALSVNDTSLMAHMPPSLTAATGIDALSHAIEAYVSPHATPITDTCAVKAIELISAYLQSAVAGNADARDKMAYAQFLAGMAFNNTSVGYTHAMAHQLASFYHLPHGVCNALLLPHVQAFNLQTVAGRLTEIGLIIKANNIHLIDLNTIDALKTFAQKLGMPQALRELNGVKKQDFELLAQRTLQDENTLSVPNPARLDDIIGIFQAAY